MRTKLLNTGVLLLLLPFSPALAQGGSAEPQPAATAAQRPVATADDQLFLSPEDIPRLQRVLPSLVDASQRGRNESQSFLARQDVGFRQLTQTLSNLSVAYSAITFDNWVKEVQPLLAARPGEYHNLIEEGRREIETITAKHQRAQRGGRSALVANKEIVARNMEAVENLIALLREVRVESLPQDPASELPPTRQQ